MYLDSFVPFLSAAFKLELYALSKALPMLVDLYFSSLLLAY